MSPEGAAQLKEIRGLVKKNEWGEGEVNPLCADHHKKGGFYWRKNGKKKLFYEPGTGVGVRRPSNPKKRNKAPEKG